MSEERWADVLGYDGLFRVSSAGRVLCGARIVATPNGGTRFYPARFMKPRTTWDGYFELELSANRKKKYVRIHRLVAIAFVPNPDNKPMINHRDGVKSNNHASNLEWVTNQENMDHAYAKNLIPIVHGSALPFAKLNEEKVWDILDRIKAGEVQRAIAKRYQVNPQIITCIKQGTVWRRVRDEWERFQGD